MLAADTAQRFISELIRAANVTDRLTPLERANLLRRSTAIVRNYRETLLRMNVALDAADARRDVTRDWAEMARMIDMFSAEDVADELLEAVSIIKSYRALLERHLHS